MRYEKMRVPNKVNQLAPANRDITYHCRSFFLKKIDILH